MAAGTFAGTEGSFTDRRDGHSYKWVRIGEQIWMAENLAYMPHVGKVGDSYTGIWVYGFQGTSVKKARETEAYRTYGCLYDLDNSMQIAPPGWHLPTHEEWLTLIGTLGGFARAGGEMKALELWNGPNTGATNVSGFTALPAGIRSFAHRGNYRNLTHGCVFWSATDIVARKTFIWRLNSDTPEIFRSDYTCGYGYSVRCIKTL